MKILIAFSAAVLLLLSCKQPANPPSDVMDSMFAAMQQGNFEDMKKHITKQDVALMETAEKFMTNIDPQGIEKIKDRVSQELKENAKHLEYRFISENIDGNKATVEAEITNKHPEADSSQKQIRQKFELVKEDNAWKISLSRPENQIFNSMKGNLGPRKGDLTEGVEKLKKMNPDSLKMLIQKGLEALDSIKAKQ